MPTYMANEKSKKKIYGAMFPVSCLMSTSKVTTVMLTTSKLLFHTACEHVLVLQSSMSDFRHKIKRNAVH